MSKKITDFLFSFGFMILGVLLIFAGTVSFNWKKGVSVSERLPIACRNENVSGQKEKSFPVLQPRLPMQKDKAVFDKELTAVAAVVMDDRSGKVLYKKNITEVRPLASITKLMSALVLLETGVEWKSSATVANSDLDPFGSPLKAGENLSIGDLWCSALVGSVNSAVNTLIRKNQIGMSVFLEKMNQKAGEISMGTLKFTDATGLDSGSRGTALDAARLLKEALEKKDIIETLQRGSCEIQPEGEKSRKIWSTNWLLTDWVPNGFSVENIVGKTGHIGESGYNFAVRLTDLKGRAVRVVVLGTASNEARFGEARDLAEWVFEHYLWPNEEGYSSKPIESTARE